MKQYFEYWGKTSEKQSHPLVYHALDTAAVASAWLQNSQILKMLLTKNNPALMSIVLFFAGIHDLGKLDSRFQIKVPKFAPPDLKIKENIYFDKYFNHSEAGFVWFKDYIKENKICTIYEKWSEETFKHHGEIKKSDQARYKDFKMEDWIIDKDNNVRREFLEDLKNLFKINAFPDIQFFPEHALAGFISVCDWIASNENFFHFENKEIDLKQYFDERKKLAENTIEKMGLLSKSTGKKPVEIFSDYTFNEIQTFMSELEENPTLTIIEAPTGSGKTEAALIYAIKLINAGLAESIIFALPTQASANAMFERLEKIASKIFKDNGSLILAHGKAQFNKEYITHLKSKPKCNEDKDNLNSFNDALNWLTQSKKRVFLGQIGVCTIDQVLLSVLPIKHNFVRSLGISKSVLIVDEIHAYDTYMHGLLDEVLERQYKLKSPVILLSATMQTKRKVELLKKWNAQLEKGSEAYPLITSVTIREDGYSIIEKNIPSNNNKKTVKLSKIKTINMSITKEVLQQCIDCALQSGRVAIICNTVKEAQNTAKMLNELITDKSIAIKLFHSKYRFKDRLDIEVECLKKCGKNGKARKYILVATQVIEQSVDLDFDFMITQLCPADLLFQRLGRLHRHSNVRPKKYETAQCLIIIPENDSYGDSKFIYENVLALWKTEQLLINADKLEFPEAYRKWIEIVYEDDDSKAPEYIKKGYNDFYGKECCRKDLAKSLVKGEYNEFNDSEKKCNELTRDTDDQINLIPYYIKNGKKVFLDDTPIPEETDLEYNELLDLNSIYVREDWVKVLNIINGTAFVEMKKTEDNCWKSSNEKKQFRYSKYYGLEFIK
ncbi:MAG: CRISPR-associated helicase/endonuclease Cas3 [Endomicrobium sp.]|jgi:CRISPR-associated endonuclease/helicase Cas3|nr:CRISPR-associated helicase/endonuclease Cas3 [Endomicrobium sp.]